MSLAEDGQSLYAVAIEQLGPNGQPVKGWIEYIHADSTIQAEIHFKTRYPRWNRFRVLGASVCVGLTMYDAKGRSLVAETSAVTFTKGLSEREQDAAHERSKRAHQ